MQVHSTINSARLALAIERADNKAIGFVPTMGALHEGHISLIEQSVSSNDSTILSIFVNPLQFGANEDLENYPRTLDDDLSKAESSGVQHVLIPSVKEMYPNGVAITTVHVGEMGNLLEGLARPRHFDGVATVVSKLLNIVGECKAYFGEKDWQQLTIVKRMIFDLSYPVEIIGCPTIRNKDGLALSSRNAYLSEKEKSAALNLYRSLLVASEMISNGIRSPLDLIAAMTDVLSDDPLVKTEYATVVDPDLRVPAFVRDDCRVLVAARVGDTRLLDNCPTV